MFEFAIVTMYDQLHIDLHRLMHSIVDIAIDERLKSLPSVLRLGLVHPTRDGAVGRAEKIVEAAEADEIVEVAPPDLGRLQGRIF